MGQPSPFLRSDSPLPLVIQREEKRMASQTMQNVESRCTEEREPEKARMKANQSERVPISSIVQKERRSVVKRSKQAAAFILLESHHITSLNVAPANRFISASSAASILNCPPSRVLQWESGKQWH